MVICPIALAVHCTGCPLVKFCPAKTFLGDFGKTEAKRKDDSQGKSAEKQDEPTKSDQG
jgi:hypothetical protein